MQGILNHLSIVGTLPGETKSTDNSKNLISSKGFILHEQTFHLNWQQTDESVNWVRTVPVRYMNTWKLCSLPAGQGAG